MAATHVLIAVLFAVLVAGTAAAARPGRQASDTASDTTDGVLDLLAGFMPDIMGLVNAPELSDTLSMAKEIVTSRWTSKEVFKSDLKTAALVSEAIRRNVPGKLTDKVKETARAVTSSAAEGAARYFPGGRRAQNSCARPKSPRMAYCKDEDEYDEEDEAMDSEDEEYRQAFERMKYVPGADDNYARVMILKRDAEAFLDTLDNTGPLPQEL
ncbi:uncharacterized protein LOC117654166 isoform X2 [Thrips palmi]|uniref:Uncharacterized protein LOC117654166 isoform X2 n=1 Tax=Thrips palmi TaxID=161013 RepID=A0A6P9AFN2_THRPL|nr:uncharacterized protein LOC117654166 isoform X2 [Thrips palmi]